MSNSFTTVCQIGLKFRQIHYKPLHNSQIFFSQSGEVLPNLVTLLPGYNTQSIILLIKKIRYRTMSRLISKFLLLTAHKISFQVIGRFELCDVIAVQPAMPKPPNLLPMFFSSHIEKIQLLMRILSWKYSQNVEKFESCQRGKMPSDPDEDIGKFCSDVNGSKAGTGRKAGDSAHRSKKLKYHLYAQFKMSCHLI